MRRKVRARSLRIEALEPRQLLTSASLSAAGLLRVADTSGDDQILLRRSSDHISIVGVQASWSASRVSSIEVDLSSGEDFVSLASFANGGNQALGKVVKVKSASAAAEVRVPGPRNIELDGGNETLVCAPGAAPKVNGTVVGKVTASLNTSTGTLTIWGTLANDNILLKQSSGRISVSGVKGWWTTTAVKWIVVTNLQAGIDYISLDSLANGGTQALAESVSIFSGDGSDDVHLANGHDVTLSGSGHMLVVADDGTAKLDGQLLTWPDPPPPPPPNPTPTWFDTNTQDAGIRAIGDQEFQDGLLDRSDMINLLREVEADGTVTNAEMTDLTTIVNRAALFGNLDYVRKLSSYIVLGNTANAHYQGVALGNLAAGSSGTQLEELVDKWFLGNDHPAAGYAYQQVAGQLFVNGAAYTDVAQGMLGDCGLIASLAETALRSPATIANMFIVNGDGTYTLTFSHSGVAEYVTVDSELPASGGYLQYAGLGISAADPNAELWYALAEKGMAQAREMSYFGGWQNAYSSVEGMYIYACLGYITGQSTVGITLTSGSSSLSAFANAWSAGKLIGLASYVSPPSPSVVGNHAYAVVGFDSATSTLTLFNPWGIQNGLLTMTWSEAQANFQYFDRTA